MGIYIDDMEMPKGCFECPFFAQVNYAFYSIILSKCKQTGEFTWESVNSYLSNCPLISIQSHGDLIDRDVLYKKFERNGWFDNADRDIAEDVLLDAPTIIQADKLKEEI